MQDLLTWHAFSRRALAEGEEITYDYRTAPGYVLKEPHVIAGCEEAPRVAGFEWWREVFLHSSALQVGN